MTNLPFSCRILLFAGICLCLLLSGFTNGAYAMSAKTTRSTTLAGGSEESPFAVRLNAGVLNGKSRELVYDETNGAKVSELIWTIEDVPIIGLSGSVALPYDMTLSVGGWTQVSTPGASMEDYDWDSSIHPTDWAYFSYSPTTLERGEMLDANLAVPLFGIENLNLSGLVGFRMDHWKWADFGGYYIYSSNPGFRDRTGTFADETGIIYEQWLYAPYLGLQFEYNLDQVTFSGRVAGSRWGWAKDKDQHENRGLVFREYFYNITYLTYGGEVTVHLDDAWSLSMSVDAQQYYRTKGDTNIEGTLNVNRIDNGAGIEHTSWMTGLSLEYRF